MCPYFKLHFYFFTFLFISMCGGLKAVAQSSSSTVETRSGKETSPYSRFGLGTDMSGTNISLRGMGYQTAAGSESYLINTDNPASYAWLKLTTYELAGEARSLTIKTRVGDYKSGTVTPAYINIGIPFNKYVAIAASLKPVNRTFYQFYDTVNVAGIGNTRNTYEGEGSLNEALVGVAGRIKGFSLGANAGFQFGDYYYKNRLWPLNADTNALSSDFARQYKINGWHFTLGAIYAADLKNKWYMRIGATASLPYDLKATKSEYWTTYRTTAPSTSLDTSIAIHELKGNVTMPMRLSGGVQVSYSDRITMGLNINYADWSRYSIMSAKDSIADRTLQYSFGVAYTPNALEMYKYFSRVTYRLGFVAGTDKVKLQNTQLSTWAVTAGFSLPFRRFTDRIHTSFEYGSRGTLNNGLIKENYFRFGLGFSLNDRWFVKPKYD